MSLIAWYPLNGNLKDNCGGPDLIMQDKIIDQYILGDINGDGVVDQTDVDMATQAQTGIITLTDDQLKRADTNQDGKLSITDVTQINQYVNGTSVNPKVGTTITESEPIEPTWGDGKTGKSWVCNSIYCATDRENTIIPKLVGIEKLSISFWTKVNSIKGNFYNIISLQLENESKTSRGIIRLESLGSNELNWYANGMYWDSMGLQKLSINVGEWVHVTLTLDGNNGYFYINGKLGASRNINKTSYGNWHFTGRMFLGSESQSSPSYYDGSICNVKIYDHILSQEEILQDYKQPMLHYSFENPYAEPTVNIPHTIVEAYTGGTTYVTLGEDSIGKYFIQAAGNGGWYGIQPQYVSVKSGRYYTWSMDVMPVKDIEYVIDGNCTCNNSSHSGNDISHFEILRGYSHGTISTKGKGKLEANKWTRIYFTVKIKEDCSNPIIFHTFHPYIPDGDTEVKVYYRNSLLEEKPYDTPYTPSSREAGLIRDNSGMGNDGTIVYERKEISFIPRTQTTCSTLSSYNHQESYNSTTKTYTITNFYGINNDVCLLGIINYNSLYHYLNSIICYEFDIKLENIVVTDGQTLRIFQQGPTIYKDDTFKWVSSPVQGIDITSRLNNGTNGTYHICIERTIGNLDCLTNASYYEFGLRFDYLKSGTITVSNIHAYYQNLDISTLSLSDNRAIGTHSVYFNGKNYVNAGIVTPSYMDELTLSCWIYKEDWTKPIVASQYSRIAGCIDWGGFGIGIDRDCYTLLNEVCNDTVGNGASYIRCDNKFDLRTFSQGWHQIVMVCDKNTAITYIDGEKYYANNHNSNLPIRTLSSYKSSSGEYMMLPFLVGTEIDGVNSSSPVYTKICDMYVDDVRLYPIALSDEDIKALYNVKTRIDNKSNLYCNQLVETKSENLTSNLKEVTTLGNYGGTSFTPSYKDGILTMTINKDCTKGSSYASIGPYILNKYYGGRLIDNERYKYSIWVRLPKTGTWKIGEERLSAISKYCEAGKWYKIEKEGIATETVVNFIFYYPGDFSSGDKIEVRDFQMYRIYDDENYNPGPNKQGQYKTFELNETFNEDIENSGATIVNKYGAEWLEVFHHNTNNNTVWFTDEAEALHTNSQYKFSILDQLENFRGTDNKFEFLLEYPEDLPSQYNRWKQSDNPSEVKEDISLSGSTKVNGYEEIHIDWSGNYWGGLLASQTSSTNTIRTFIDGSTNHKNWYYSIGCYNNVTGDWENAMPGPNNTSSTGMKEVNLYVRIDNLENKNKIFRQYKRQTKIKEIIEM